MSPSTLAPYEHPAEGSAEPVKPRAAPKRGRESVADGVWILAATALFVVFQVIGLL